MITLIYDPALRRPACVLLQAASGCDYGALSRYFGSETWLVSPTPGMRRVTGTADEWRRAAVLPARGQK